MHRIKRKATVTTILPLLAFLSAGCLPDSLMITPVSRDRSLKEKKLYSESLLPDGKIAIIHVDGVLTNSKRSGLLRPGERPVVELLEQLDRALRDRAVKAVVLRINSPGGTVTASELIHDEIEHFRESKKPVVVMMMDVAASGGYYIACAADQIMAHRSTVTGSIGVVMQLFEVTGTMHKIGVTAEAITSGDQKAAGSPFATLRPEHRAIFQGIVDGLFAQFVDVVAAGRPNLSRERIMQLADGRVYSAQQALDAGLIDKIGSLRDAIESAKQKAGIKRAKVVSYATSTDHVPNYYAADPVPNPQTEINLLRLDLADVAGTASSPFMYLWSPSVMSIQ